MNPSAASYTPSFALARKVRHEIPVAAKSAGPHPSGGHGAAPNVSPMVLPRDALSMMAASVPTPTFLPETGGPAKLTAADRLRLLHPRHAPAGTPSGHLSASATPGTSAHATPALSGGPAALSAVSPSMAAASSSVSAAVSSSPPPLPPRAREREGVIRYTRAELLALERAAIEAIERGPVADAPPFTRLPASFVPLLSLPHALEFVNVDAASALMEGRPYSAPFVVTSSDALPSSTAAMASASGPSGGAAAANLTGDAMTVEGLHCYHCLECARGGPRPCDALATVIFNAKRYIMTQALGRCFLQAPEVVWGQIQLALVFEAKQSSLRLRMLAEKSPAIPRRVGEFLFGEGYHLALPRVTAHEEWRTAMQMLKFDAIRDNRTRVVTDFSKHWKKRHTQFEQFVAFFNYRDDVPITEVKNMLTRSVKPGMVAMLTGDVVAVILLHHLGFFIPPDYYWSVFPFLGPALGEGTMTHDVIRHLGCYFSSKQSPHMFNPVVNPFAAYPL